jgi:hypothetical protein
MIVPAAWRSCLGALQQQQKQQQQNMTHHDARRRNGFMTLAAIVSQHLQHGTGHSTKGPTSSTVSRRMAAWYQDSMMGTPCCSSSERTLTVQSASLQLPPLSLKMPALTAKM